MKNGNKYLLIFAALCLSQELAVGMAQAGRMKGFASMQSHLSCTQLEHNCQAKNKGKEAICKQKFTTCIKTGDWGPNHGITRY
jgi:hypothetical protein